MVRFSICYNTKNKYLNSFNFTKIAVFVIGFVHCSMKGWLLCMTYVALSNSFKTKKSFWLGGAFYNNDSYHMLVFGQRPHLNGQIQGQHFQGPHSELEKEN